MSDTYKINSTCQPSEDVITIDWNRADSFLDYNNSTLPLFNDISMISGGGTGSHTVSIHGANLAPNVYITSGTSSGFNVDESFATSLHTSNNISLQGEDADIKINGESVMETLRWMKDRLAWLDIRSDLESEWQELRELGDQYRAMVATIENKVRMWDTLKKMPPPEMP